MSSRSVLVVGSVIYRAYRIPRSDVWHEGFKPIRFPITREEWLLESFNPEAFGKYQQMDPKDLTGVSVRLAPESRFRVPVAKVVQQMNVYDNPNDALIAAFLKCCVHPPVRAVMVEESLWHQKISRSWERVLNHSSILWYEAHEYWVLKTVEKP